MTEDRHIPRTSKSRLVYWTEKQVLYVNKMDIRGLSLKLQEYYQTQVSRVLLEYESGDFCSLVLPDPLQCTIGMGSRRKQEILHEKSHVRPPLNRTKDFRTRLIYIKNIYIINVE